MKRAGNFGNLWGSLASCGRLSIGPWIGRRLPTAAQDAILPHMLILVVVCAAAYGELPAPEQAAIDRISADSLRTNLSYLASDALEGRATPSHGLDLAAEYIAAQFRRAGLEPAEQGSSYFQSAKFDQTTVDMEGFQLLLASGDEEIDVHKDEVRVQSLAGLDLTAAPVLKLPGNGAIPPIAGMVVAGDERRYGTEAFLNELQKRKPALILLVGRTRDTPRNTPGAFLDEADGNHAPVIRIRRSEAAALLRGAGDITVSLHLARPSLKEVLLRNVAGTLRGSDPVLRDQYLLLTAHYDHLGRNAKGIFNGANDNGSGTVSVIEIARALAALTPHPKRSILFVALFGEEEGLLGAYYYARHPLAPLKNTVANINLEQMGRTDDPGGREITAFGFTGPSFSNLPAIMGDAAKAEGVSVYRRKDADDFFNRSDNYAFAQYGVIAHTIAVAFEYPDYHGLGDKSEKIDYANMAKVDRGVAAGILKVADEPEAPRWSDSKAAGIYRDAGRGCGINLIRNPTKGVNEQL
jgi:Peptidase family M28